MGRCLLVVRYLSTTCTRAAHKKQVPRSQPEQAQSVRLPIKWGSNNFFAPGRMDRVEISYVDVITELAFCFNG